jgi:hypothetical protein
LTPFEGVAKSRVKNGHQPSLELFPSDQATHVPSHENVKVRAKEKTGLEIYFTFSLESVSYSHVFGLGEKQDLSPQTPGSFRRDPYRSMGC